MGKVLINGGGGGGGGSSDEMALNNGITANLVPSGKTYIGADTDDEIGTGTMNLAGNAEPKYVLKDKTFITKNADLPNKYQKGTMANVGGLENAKTARVANNNLILGMTNGAHITNSSGQSYPEVQTPYSTVASKLGVTAAKVANGSTIAGVTGTYKGLGNATQSQVLSGKTFSTASLSNAVGTMANVAATEQRKSYALSGTNLVLRMTNGGHVTNASSGYPEVYIPQSEVASAYGVTANKIAFGQTVMGITGTNAGGAVVQSDSPFVNGTFPSGTSLNNFGVSSWGSNVGEYSGSDSKSLENSDHIHITFRNYNYDKSWSHSSGAIVSYNKLLSFSQIRTITMKFMPVVNTSDPWGSTSWTYSYFYFQIGTTNGSSNIATGKTSFTPQSYSGILRTGTMATATWDVSSITVNGYFSIHFEGGNFNGSDSSDGFQWHYTPFMNIYSLTFV